jgi:hypothetical protein
MVFFPIVGIKATAGICKEKLKEKLLILSWFWPGYGTELLIWIQQKSQIPIEFRSDPDQCVSIFLNLSCARLEL